MKTPGMLSFVLMTLVILVTACSSVGDAEKVHGLERQSAEHGKENLTNYALNLLANVAGEKIASLQVDYTAQKQKLLEATENKAAEVSRLELSYQAHLDLIQQDILGEFQKIALMWRDFENAARLGAVVDKALQTAGDVDVDAVIDVAAQAAGALESSTGLKLGPLTSILQRVKSARGLPTLANTSPIAPQ